MVCIDERCLGIAICEEPSERVFEDAWQLCVGRAPNRFSSTVTQYHWRQKNTYF